MSRRLLRTPISEYEITRLEPRLITMRHRSSGQTYRYVEALSEDASHELLDIPGLLPPLQAEGGLLYPTGQASLAQQCQLYARGGRQCAIGEHEIVNTVEPIVEILRLLHGQGVWHGAVHPGNIVVDDQGLVKVYYPGIRQKQRELRGEDKLTQDFKDLAATIMCMLGFDFGSLQHQQISNLRQVARNGKYSQAFVFSIFCMLTGSEQHLPPALQFFSSPDEPGARPQRLTQRALQLFQEQFLQPGRRQEMSKRLTEKVEFTPPLLKHSEHVTPRKTLQVTKKYSRIEDAENKNQGDQNRRRRQGEILVKRVSNGKSQAENNGSAGEPCGYKKLLRDIRETKQREDVFRVNMTAKRLKTMEKKKIY